MAVRIQKKRQRDPELEALRKALFRFVKENAFAQLSILRQAEFLIRARILDPQFKGLTIGERQKKIWPYLEELSDETVNELGQLLLLTPDEAKQSYANREFENPELLSDD